MKKLTGWQAYSVEDTERFDIFIAETKKQALKKACEVYEMKEKEFNDIMALEEVNLFQ